MTYGLDKYYRKSYSSLIIHGVETEEALFAA